MQRFITPLLIVTAGVFGLFAFVAPIEAGGGGHGGCQQKPSEGANEPVVIRQSCFTPTVLHVEQGATVTWRNEDQDQHNVTFLDGVVADGDSYLLPGESASHTFDTAGLSLYFCSLHPSMVGVVAVGDASAFAFQAPAQPAPVPASEPATASASSDLSPTVAGLVLAVGLVSAGGGYYLRRRAA